MQKFLDFSKIEETREDERIIQVDDGTTFYWRFSVPHKLYVKSQGREIDADLPGEEIKCCGTFGNFAYFISNEQVYRAVFSTPESITVSYLRDQQEDDIARWGFHTITRGNEKFVYRLSDDPNNESSLIIVTKDELNGMEMRRIHRDNIVLSSRKAESVWPSARKVRDNAILIETREQYTVFVSESSPFLYLTDGKYIFTLNTRTMEFLPTLEFHDAYVSYFVGIHDGILTCMGLLNGEYCLMSAQLPEGYHELPTNVNNQEVVSRSENIDVKKLREQYEEEKKRADALTDQIEDKDKKLNCMTLFMEKLEGNMETLREKNAQLAEENLRIRQLEEENAKLSEENLRITALEVEKQFEKNEEENKKKDAIAEIIVNKDNEIYLLRSAVGKLNDEIVILREKIAQFSQENLRIRQLEVENMQLKDEIIELQKEITELTEEDDEGAVSDTVNDLRAVIARLRRESSTVKYDQTAKINEEEYQSISPEPEELELSPVPLDPDTEEKHHPIPLPRSTIPPSPESSL